MDQRFIDVMGSSYLLAHGLGKPCSPAKGSIVLPQAGRYRVRVPPHAVLPDGEGD